MAFIVWQRRELNEWVLLFDAAVGNTAPQTPPPNADPFSLGDPEATASILERAGFEAMRFDDVHEPVLYGHDIDAALEEVLGFQDVNATLAGMSEADARCGVERLRAVLAAHRSGDRGIAVDSRSWLITARRRER